jgi:ketosteroid isomerase-like protein
MQNITDQELAALIQRTEAANDAWMKGDTSDYAALATQSDDFTLMAPFGGAPTCGGAAWVESLPKVALAFKNGSSVLELVQTYASGDLVVLVMIERQRGEVGGLADQDWSLRVTQVYRREVTESVVGWHMVHRHADPIVQAQDLRVVAAIARGVSLS